MSNIDGMYWHISQKREEIERLLSEIYELEREKNSLVGFRKEALKAAQEASEQLRRRRSVSDSFESLSRDSTLAVLIKNKMQSVFSTENSRTMEAGFDGIINEADAAVQRVEVEIQQRKDSIRLLEYQIDGLYGDIRAEQQRLENEKRREMEQNGCNY